MTEGIADLSVRARRGELTETEERQLRLLITSSLEARLTHRAGWEFDAEDSVLPGDDALAARVTERVLRGLQPALVPRRRLGFKLAAAMALGVAAAAAAPAVMHGWGRTLLAPPSNVRPIETARPAPFDSGACGSASPPTASSAVVMPSVPPASSARAEGAPGVAWRGSSPASSSSSATRSRERPSSGAAPEALFAEASRARRQGDTPRAIALYQDLQRRHPSAVESQAADIALGMLYSEQAPSAAVKHFSQYLDRGGPLAPEALWGRARALDVVGRTEEARDDWQALLTRYPQSAYAQAASAKLGTNQ